MNRRTLLKGAAATTALGTLGMRRPQKSAAARRVRIIQQELPMYEIVSFYVSEELIPYNGSNFRGVPRDISNDGTIFGEIVQNQLLAPAVWDASLSLSILDTGEFAGQSVNLLFGNDGGRVIGVASEVTGLQTEEQVVANASASAPVSQFIAWQDGMVDSDFMATWPEETFFNTLAPNGALAGGSGDVPARWVENVYEPVQMPAGFALGGTRSIAASGMMAGTLYATEEPLSGGTPFLWNTDGTVLVLDPPGVSDPLWQGRLQVFGLQDDGSLAAVVRGQNDLYGRAIRYANGQQTPISDLNGEGMFVRDANASGVLIGQSMLNGYSIPTMWVNDYPIAIAELIVPGPDLLLMEVNGINDAGAMVGEAQDSAGLFHHVLLRPV